MRRTDRINNWDLVDVACPYVVGVYLSNKPRDVLYELARSENMWERRTAIVSTYFFIRQGDVDDTFRIAEVLLDDQEDLIHKAAGGWLREAGKKDRRRLRTFLDGYAATMPRTMLRYALEHLDKEERKHYLSGPIRKFFDTSHAHAAATDEDASGSCSARRERSRSRSWRVNFQANGSANCS